MIVRDVKDCTEITAGDSSLLREILHPDKGPFAIRYSLARAVVRPGGRTAPHELAGSEVYYILGGRGVMHINGESAAVGAGQAVYIPPKAVQFIENTGPEDLVFLCLVDPAWRPEDETVVKEPEV